MQALDQALFLARVDDVWQDHCEQMLTIRSIFLYLDRSHVLQTPGLQPLWEMGLALFRQQLAQQGQQPDSGMGMGMGMGVGVEARVIRGLLDLVERQRNGESVNVSLLRSLVRMLVSLGLYKPTFLRAFLEDTGRYFAAEGERRMETLDVVGFLRHVEGRLLEAQEAVVQYLEPGTRRPLMQAIEAQLLAPHVTALIEKGFEPLMDANRCVGVWFCLMGSRQGVGDWWFGRMYVLIFPSVPSISNYRVEDLQLMASLCMRKQGGAEELKAAFNAYIRKVRASECAHMCVRGIYAWTPAFTHLPNV